MDKPNLPPMGEITHWFVDYPENQRICCDRDLSVTELPFLNKVETDDGIKNGQNLSDVTRRFPSYRVQKLFFRTRL